MKNIPHTLLTTLSPRALAEREQAGLPPYTDDERRAIIAEVLDNPAPPVPRDEAVRRYWSPRYVSWKRWHAENPGACDCTPDQPGAFCLPPPLA
ncbi:hypothetical protein DQ384_05190 [Sphaerisporangium album]|uniref:Uncharacterized protein n=1 Tax=Sphaerisporangium album TaxID=509200 RepID=A0A367FPV8_9ACTN|nr:hypothetical protein [Sphaerisporangium album]RCG31939.1 hypothetical protein DQ384_05190 [Sphaerisporangium album]